MSRNILLAGLILLLEILCSHAAIIGSLDVGQLRLGVVRIVATTSGDVQKVGTGFIVQIQKDLLYIVTAAHVVSGDEHPRVQFYTQPDVSIQATVKHLESEDEITGLALLVVQGKDILPPELTAMTLAASVHPIGSEDIIIIGHPRDAGDWAVLRGSIVSRKGRFIFVDSNIDEGCSGGPILRNGEVVGLVGGITRYGRAVTSDSIRAYLDGHGVRVQRIQIPIEGSSTPPIIPEGSAKVPSSREARERDESPMVMIPAGDFLMGSLNSEGYGDEHPRHQIYLDTYLIDKFEVTVSRYEKFLRSTSNQIVPLGWAQARLDKHGNFPVVGVDWYDAVSYCKWTGKRLPTEAEWEKAARGPDARTYPWGNDPPTPRLTNAWKGMFTENAYEYRLVSVDSYEVGNSPYGLHHMAGNVWEWTADWYDSLYYSKSPNRNPKGPANGAEKVIRGGSWSMLFQPVVRSAYRHRIFPAARGWAFGFRCARDSSNEVAH